MVQVETSTTIERPVHEVFEFVKDENNIPGAHTAHPPSVRCLT